MRTHLCRRRAATTCIAASGLRRRGKLSRSKIHRILVNNVSLLLSMLCTANVSIRVERSNVPNSALMTGVSAAWQCTVVAALLALRAIRA